MLRARRVLLSPAFARALHSTPRLLDEPDGFNHYVARKFRHKLPENDVRLRFDALHGIPSGVFRETSGEYLGPCADKCAEYKNPEYFSYHHMSFFDLHVQLRRYRLPTPVADRKP